MRKLLLHTVFAVTGWCNRCARPRGRIDCTISIGRPLLAVRSADHVPKKNIKCSFAFLWCRPVCCVRTPTANRPDGQRVSIPHAG